MLEVANQEQAATTPRVRTKAVVHEKIPGNILGESIRHSCLFRRCLEHSTPLRSDRQGRIIEGTPRRKLGDVYTCRRFACLGISRDVRRIIRDGLRDPKIDELQPRLDEHKVRWLEVPVDHLPQPQP